MALSKSKKFIIEHGTLYRNAFGIWVTQI